MKTLFFMSTVALSAIVPVASAEDASYLFRIDARAGQGSVDGNGRVPVDESGDGWVAPERSPEEGYIPTEGGGATSFLEGDESPFMTEVPTWGFCRSDSYPTPYFYDCDRDGRQNGVVTVRQGGGEGDPVFSVQDEEGDSWSPTLTAMDVVFGELMGGYYPEAIPPKHPGDENLFSHRFARVVYHQVSGYGPLYISELKFDVAPSERVNWRHRPIGNVGNLADLNDGYETTIGNWDETPTRVVGLRSGDWVGYDFRGPFQYNQVCVYSADTEPPSSEDEGREGEFKLEVSDDGRQWTEIGSMSLGSTCHNLR